jgi:hypothetical protein
MAIKIDNKFPDLLDDDIGLCLREMTSFPTWVKAKFESFERFRRLAKKERHSLFTADVRDYKVSGSGVSCLYQVPTNQRGALSRFRGKYIRLICGGKSNRYSGRFYYAKPLKLIDLAFIGVQ